MPKITITEADLTRTNVAEDVSNVVYIPGFSTAKVNMAAQFDDFVPTSGENAVNGMPPMMPKLCKTLAEFYTFFGQDAPKFVEQLSYPVQTAASDDGPFVEGFASIAVKGLEGTNMFEKGEVDPSYIMATELLRAGIPVLYERVNYLGSEIVKAGEGVPTAATVGTIGDVYIDITETEEPEANAYICTAVKDGKYTWVAYGDKHFEVEGTTVKTTAPDIDGLTMYAFLSNAFKNSTTNPNALYDLNEYDISYITTGGYPVFEYDDNAIVEDMFDIATIRGDATALIDHVNNPTRTLVGDDSVFGSVNGEDYGISNDHAAMYTPWYLATTSSGNRYMPGSFAYLISLAEAILTSPNWLAVAGVARGVVPGAKRLNTIQKLTNSIADSYVNSKDSGKVCINPITNIKNFGLTIWGNRTLSATSINTEKALYFANMRIMINEVKKACYRASQRLMFEQNSDILWTNFKARITPLLDRMSTSNALAGYSITRIPSDSKTEVKAEIKLRPIYPVEEFTIAVVLTNEDVNVEEE